MKNKTSFGKKEKHPYFGKHLSDKHKENIRKGLLGRKVWNKGKKTPEDVKEKMRQAHLGSKNHFYGKTHSDEVRNKLRILSKERWTGSGNPNWRGGISYKYRTLRQSLEYRFWRLSVFKRDKYTCQKCKDNKGGNLEAHHIRSFAKYPKLRFVVENGMTLCKKCHKKTDTYAKHLDRK